MKRGEPMDSSFYEDQQRRRQDKRQLRRYGNLFGGGVIAFEAISVVVVVALVLLNKLEWFESDPIFASAINGMITILGMFLPFLLLYTFLGETAKPAVRAVLGGPYRGSRMGLTIPIGVLFCLVANFITVFFVSFLEKAGLSLSSPELEFSFTPLGVTMGIVQIAVVPALVEEFAMRGVVMQPLRRYGDRFAIAVSAVLFAVMHGNLVQAPFALIIGLVIGYFVVVTGSIWTGVLIHFCNNLYAVLLTMLSQYGGEDELNWIYLVVNMTILVAGAVCLAVYGMRGRKRQLCPPSTQLSGGEKASGFFLTPGMLIVIAIAAYTSWNFMEFTR